MTTDHLPIDRGDDLDSNAETARLARAVVYLRVSTKEQAERGGNAEGFSIPAQREACQRKAASIRAEVVEEFIDAGESAKTAHRPELQRMLAYLRDNPTTFVICHKIDRLARNRVDDVEINVAIRASGATLVSCTENIDETPSGALMHGIMSSIAEFYSKNLANEVIKGSVQKAKSGGTVGKAPTGYLNVRRVENGREIRTVEVDPERGPLMRWVFEQYATGEWSLRRLLEAATDKGLTARGGPRTPSKPLSLSNFCRLLSTPYFYGLISYRGVEYEGTHEPLISKALYDKVQQVLKAHALSGEKRRKHHHHLVGSVFCGQCGSRLGVMNAKNRYGTIYPYFFCLGKQEKRTNCTQRTVRIEKVEELIEQEWHLQRMSEGECRELEDFIRDELQQLDRQNEAERHRQQHRIDRLRSERKKLLQAHYADAMPLDLFKDEQLRIGAELAACERLLAQATAEMEKVAVAVGLALALVVDCGESYRKQTPTRRRQMNQSLFTKIYVGDDGSIEGQYTEEYRLLLDTSLRELAHEARHAPRVTRPQQPFNSKGESDGVLAWSWNGHQSRKCRTPTFAGRGSKDALLVGEGGLELSLKGCWLVLLSPSRTV